MLHINFYLEYGEWIIKQVCAMEQAVLFDGAMVPYKNIVTLVQIDANTFKVKVAVANSTSFDLLSTNSKSGAGGALRVFWGGTLFLIHSARHLTFTFNIYL